MKKFLYILMISTVCALSFSSCTEEEVAPSDKNNQGGAVLDPIRN